MVSEAGHLGVLVAQLASRCLGGQRKRAVPLEVRGEVGREHRRWQRRRQPGDAGIGPAQFAGNVGDIALGVAQRAGHRRQVGERLDHDRPAIGKLLDVLTPIGEDRRECRRSERPTTGAIARSSTPTPVTVMTLLIGAY